MISNVRSKPIEGHITDNAGNILRNSKIVVKQVTPIGSYPVDSVISDDGGYFKTKPIQNGSYDIYESGIIVAKTIHDPDLSSIQCFKAHQDNFNIEEIENFDQLATDNVLSNFKSFIQIESQEVNVEQYGNLFPIYDVDIASEPAGMVQEEDELWNLAQYFGLGSESRITTTRFDVEYFEPITITSKNYHRIRWSGVPAIRFHKDSKLVIPLDYFSIVPNHPKSVTPHSSTFPVSDVVFTDYPTGGDKSYLVTAADNSEFKDLLRQLKKGDLLKCMLDQGGYPEVWYGVVTDYTTTSTGGTIQFEEFRSSRFGLENLSGDYDVLKIYSYDGMFRGISEINEEVNERFTVVENNSAQDDESEIYNYTRRYVP